VTDEREREGDNFVAKFMFRGAPVREVFYHADRKGMIEWEPKKSGIRLRWTDGKQHIVIDAGSRLGARVALRKEIERHARRRRA